MDVAAFLERIGVTTLPGPELERLQTLHRAIGLTVPYENLAILEGRSISLEIPDLLEKVVGRRRGGYCYELNGVFAHLLETLGFEVERHLARVWSNGYPAPPLTHLVLGVTVAGKRYLCDVGFGGGTLREPVPWELNEAVTQGPDRFRLVAADHGETMLQSFVLQQWKDLYSILPCAVRPQDVIPANHYSSTHPDSFFTRFPMAALNTSDGRITLRGRLFRCYGAKGVQERELASVEDFLQVVSRDFGLGGLDCTALGARLSGLFAPPS